MLYICVYPIPQTLLSLSKLAALASGGRSQSVQEIDTELQYIAYQQNLPKEVIEVCACVCVCSSSLVHLTVMLFVLYFGFPQIDDGDPETMPPLSPQKIVEVMHHGL